MSLFIVGSLRKQTILLHGVFLTGAEWNVGLGRVCCRPVYLKLWRSLLTNLISMVPN